MTEVHIPIHPETEIGSIALRIPGLERSLSLYQHILGLRVLGQEAGNTWLGPTDGKEILILNEDPQAQPVNRPATGLYHLAIRVPTRADLGAVLRRLVRARWPLQGFADHLVSEAIYLPDADGNGIEIYRDRPRSEWPVQNGQVQMSTEPLDTDSLLAEAEGRSGGGEEMPAGTVLGHVHLKVANIAESVAFYTNVLGFDLMQRYGPSAAFVSAGGYHHHIGFNTWNSAGAAPPPAGAIGLRYFSILLPGEEDLKAVIDRLRQAALPFQEQDRGFRVRDPSQNEIWLTVDGRSED